LFEAFACEPPPDAAAAAERRIRAAIELAGRRDHRGAAGGIRARLGARFAKASRRGRAVALLAAVLILGGAGGGLLAIYEGMVGSGGGLRTAWDRAAVLGISQTIDGYRVTIERAYADPNQLMLAISVDDLDRRGWTQVAAMGVDVTDEQGRPFGHSMGMSSPDGSAAAANLAWLTPPPGLTSGQHTLHVSIPSISVRDNTTPPPDESSGDVKGGDSWNPWHEVAGPWTFTIPLDVAGGSFARPDNAASVGGTEVRLTQVTVSPSSVNATIRVTGGGTGGPWAPIGQFEHAGGPSIAFNSNGGGDGAITLQALDGTTSASGDWILRIDELVGDDGPSVRLNGPWEIVLDAVTPRQGTGRAFGGLGVLASAVFDAEAATPLKSRQQLAGTMIPARSGSQARRCRVSRPSGSRGSTGVLGRSRSAVAAGVGSRQPRLLRAGGHGCLPARRRRRSIADASPGALAAGALMLVDHQVSGPSADRDPHRCPVLRGRRSSSSVSLLGAICA
jgi:hypothetical protein